MYLNIILNKRIITFLEYKKNIKLNNFDDYLVEEFEYIIFDMIQNGKSEFKIKEKDYIEYYNTIKKDLETDKIDDVLYIIFLGFEIVYQFYSVQFSPSTELLNFIKYNCPSFSSTNINK